MQVLHKYVFTQERLPIEQLSRISRDLLEELEQLATCRHDLQGQSKTRQANFYHTGQAKIHIVYSHVPYRTVKIRIQLFTETSFAKELTF